MSRPPVLRRVAASFYRILTNPRLTRAYAVGNSDLAMTDHRDLYSGLIRLHILHHAEKGEIFGLGMIEELSRHGYRLSAGTLYPILHGLEARGYLKATAHRNGRRIRRMYRATPAGRRVLAAAKAKVRELFGELFEND